jgi:hypothetical protein
MPACCALVSGARMLVPVRLPSGCLRLSTRSVATGSSAKTAATIGMSLVSRLATSIAVASAVTMTSIFKSVSSAAKVRRRCAWSDHRYSLTLDVAQVAELFAESSEPPSTPDVLLATSNSGPKWHPCRGTVAPEVLWKFERAVAISATFYRAYTTLKRSQKVAFAK